MTNENEQTRLVPSDQSSNVNEFDTNNSGAYIGQRSKSLAVMSDNMRQADDGDEISPSFGQIGRKTFGITPHDKLRRRLTTLSMGNDNIAERVDSLHLMRPFKLIGDAQRLVNWNKYTTSELKIKASKKDVAEYYEKQNDYVERYREVDALLDTGIHIEMIQNYADNTSSDETSSENEIDLESQSVRSLTKKKKPFGDHKNVPIVPGNINSEGARLMGYEEDSISSSKNIEYAINLNFGLNFVLLLGKIFMIYFTNSFSIIASVVDSVLDFLSTLIIFFASKYANQKSSRFPIGRKQLEPLGVLVFSVIIIVSFLQVLIESLKALIGGNHEIRELNFISITVMALTILTKAAAWLLCRNVNNSSIQALTEDAKTDIVFNTFSLIFPAIGSLFQWWFIDPFGACLLCFYVVIQWAFITFEHIDHLSGAHAPKEYYQQVLYMIFRYTDKISKIKNYKMYYMGDQVTVEVDIVVKNKDMTLKDYHDIGESLQYAIETLPYVSRCFVHVDYKVRNYAGHLQ